MRIISKFHDYYDGVMSYDSDRSLIYQRESSIVIYKNPKDYPLPICHGIGWNWYGSQTYFSQMIIGFCGRLYPSLVFFSGFDSKIPTTRCHNLEEVDNFIARHFDEDFWRKYKIGSKTYWRNKRDDIKTWFGEVESKKDSYRKTLFEDRQCPIFLSQYKDFKWQIEFNASFKNTDFVTTFSPWEAYQEISMFLGGLAVPQNPIPAIDDKTMAEIKGFDKYSFRKDAQK